LVFGERLMLPTAAAPRPSPCASCAGRPCLRACPVGAFTAGGYDAAACRAHLHTLSGQECVIQGCRARAACPVGRGHAYAGAQAQHHMRAFARAP
jgi:Fe-S-cluster-containing hydrogenase component 2